MTGREGEREKMGPNPSFTVKIANCLQLFANVRVFYGK